MKKFISLLIVFCFLLTFSGNCVCATSEDETKLKIIDLNADSLVKCGTNIYELKKTYSASDGYVIKLAAYDENNVLIGTSSDDDYRQNFPKNFGKILAFVWRTYSENGNNITSASLQVGANENEKRIVWYNDKTANKGRVQIALKSDFIKDGGFTEDNSKIVNASVETPYNNSTSISCKAIIEDLKLGETYIYRLGGENSFSEKIYEFTNQDPNGKQVFNVVSDLHYGMWNFDSVKELSVLNKVKLMDNVWQTMLDMDPKLSFVISTGDNVSQANMGYTSGSTDELYRTKAEMEMEALFTAESMQSVPFASTLGNHEAKNVTGDTPNPYASVTKYHFNLPNDDGQSGHHIDCNTSGNFWFRNGDVLVIGITATRFSTGSMYGTTASVNEKYIKNACDANKDAKWRILVNHVPAYASSAGFSETVVMRKVFADMNLDSYDIDAVFTGHSHAFTRSKQLLTNCTTGETTTIGNEKLLVPKVVSQDKIKTSIDKNGYQISEVTDPEGTVHYNVPATSDGGFYAMMEDYKTYTNAFGIHVNGKKELTYGHNNEIKYDESEFPGIILYSSPMYTNVTVEDAENGSKMTIKVIQSNATVNSASDSVNVIDTYIINKSN